MAGQAQLLRRHRLGRAGRELRPLPLKGRGVAIDGRLEWREWTTQEGQKRQAVEIVADTVQFLSSPDGAGGGGGFSARSDVPVDTGDFAPVGGGNGSIADDDIPF